MLPIREWLSSVPTGGCNCNRLDYFLSLSLSFLPSLSYSHSSSLFPSFCLLLSGRSAPSPLICSRNEDGEFQRESSSCADARCPTPALPQCSLVPSLLSLPISFSVSLPFPLPHKLSFSRFSLPVSLICKPPSPPTPPSLRR